MGGREGVWEVGCMGDGGMGEREGAWDGEGARRGVDAEELS